MKNQSLIWNKLYKGNKNLWNKQANFLSNLLKNKNVLEIGVGNGKTLYSIIRQKPQSITAIDISNESIKLSKSIFKNQNIEFIKSNIIKTKFKSQQFDVIVCYYILNNLKESERKKAVNEMHRILTKTGTIIFEDFQKGDFRQSGKEIELNTILKKSGLLHHFFTKTEIKSLFSKFRRIKIKEKSFAPFRKTKLKRNLLSAIITK